jgi:hypothetical protein
MKSLKIFLTFSILSSVLLVFANTAKQESKVYVCLSGTSYAYHNKYCQGLRKCTHKIDTVTIKQATKSGHGKACGYCYR